MDLYEILIIIILISGYTLIFNEILSKFNKRRQVLSEFRRKIYK